MMINEIAAQNQETAKAVARRVNMERAIAARVVDAVLDAGYKIRVWADRECVTIRTADKRVITEAMFTGDTDTLFLYQADGKFMHNAGWVLLVYGANGFDVIADYPQALAAVLAPALSLAAEYKAKAVQS